MTLPVGHALLSTPSTFQIKSDRKELIKSLSELVADRNNHAAHYLRVEKAMDLLGDLRAAEAADVLVENIGFPEVMPGDAPVHLGLLTGFGRMTLRERLPAIRALIQIGEPCVDRVIAKMLATPNVTEYEACVIVLKSMEATTTAQKVKRAIEVAPPELRDRLIRSFGKR